MTIIPFRSEFRLALFEIDHFCFNPPWSESQWESELSNPWLHLMIQDHTLVGFILGQQNFDEYELFKIAVHPDHQGQGLAQQLLTFHLQQFPNLNIQQGYLEVRKSNFSAKHLYFKLGWVIIGTRKAYYSDGEDAEIWSYTHEF